MALEIEEISVDCYRNDLKYQLETAGELDWDYFVETAKRAQEQANKTGVNMTWENMQGNNKD